jgi:hypothetical protein
MGRIRLRPSGTTSARPACVARAAHSLMAHSCGSGPRHQQMPVALSCSIQSGACGATPAARGCGRVTLGGSLGVLGKGSCVAPVQGRGGTEDGLTGGGAGSAGRESKSDSVGEKQRRSNKLTGKRSWRRCLGQCGSGFGQGSPETRRHCDWRR